MIIPFLNQHLARPARALACLSLALALSACSLIPISPASAPHPIKMPQKRLTDYLLSQCQDLWQTTLWQPALLQQDDYSENPLYWMRLIECAQRLTDQQISSQINALGQTSWQDRLRRAILQANRKMTVTQQQQTLDNLNSLAPHIPASVWPLFQLWRDQQASRLALAQTHERYHKLQQTTDNEQDNLRQQLQNTRQKLEETSRKLESLTDIERQLSTRKAAEGFTPPAGRTPGATESRAPKAPSRQEPKP